MIRQRTTTHTGTTPTKPAVIKKRVDNMALIPKGTTRLLSEGLNIGVGLKGTQMLTKFVIDKANFLDKVAPSVPRSLKGLTLTSGILTILVPRIFKKTKVEGKSMKVGPFSANRIIRIMSATTIGFTFLWWINYIAVKAGINKTASKVGQYFQPSGFLTPALPNPVAPGPGT